MGRSPTTPATTSETPAASRRRFWRKLAKRWLIALGGVLIVLGVVFLLLPVWISNEQGRSYVLQRVNKGLAGTLDIKNWSVSWWRGMTIDELTLTLPNGRRVVHCPHIQTELTLWSLLWGSYDVGNTRMPGASITLTKYADGSTDITRLFVPGRPGGNWRGFRSLRGAIQLTGGDLTLASERGGQSVELADFSAEVTIASPLAPFYVRVRGLAGGPAVSCDAVMPATANWPPSRWEILSGMNLTAGGLPTAVVADWVGLGAGWQDALGTEIDSLGFQSGAVGRGVVALPDASEGAAKGSWIAALQVRGKTGAAWIDIKLLCSGAGADGKQTRLSLPVELKLNPQDPSAASLVRDFRCEAALYVSPPVRALLRHVNPVLGGLSKAKDAVSFSVQALDVSADRAQTSGGTMMATVRIPPGELANEGILREILGAGNMPADAAERGPAVGATFGPLVIRLEGRELTSRRFTIATTGSGFDQMSFSGRANLDGHLSMTVTRTRVGGGTGLTTSTVEMPMTGTVDDPHVAMP